MKNGKSGQLEIRPNLRHYQSIRVSLSAPRIRPFPRTLKTITAPQCLITTRKAAQKVNIDIKSTLFTDFENNNSTSMPWKQHILKRGFPYPTPFKIIIDEKGVTDAYEDRPIKDL